jgi:hypothetical protein
VKPPARGFGMQPVGRMWYPATHWVQNAAKGKAVSKTALHLAQAGAVIPTAAEGSRRRSLLSLVRNVARRSDLLSDCGQAVSRTALHNRSSRIRDPRRLTASAYVLKFSY